MGNSTNATDLFTDQRGLLQGTLELLILRALTWGATHGYGIAAWIERRTDDALRVEEGSLYPALHRLEEKELIVATWGVSENNRRAKFYQLTELGRQRLVEKTASWERLVAAMTSALQPRDAST